MSDAAAHVTLLFAMSGSAVTGTNRAAGPKLERKGDKYRR